MLKQFSVLYAEDHIKVQKSVVEFLKEYFKNVYTADNGQEALENYSKFQPDVLILDIDMPIIDGLSVAKQIRETNEEIPIIILTAYTYTKELLRATELNLSKYLVKPSNQNQFFIKPIDPFEFQKVIQNITKKLEKSSSKYFKLSDTSIWKIEEKELWVNDKIVKLSNKEKILLTLLIKNHKNCVEFTDIMNTVWEDSFDIEISNDAVKKQIQLLRKKLPPNSIENVYGSGYMLV